MNDLYTMTVLSEYIDHLLHFSINVCMPIAINIFYIVLAL